MDPLLEIGRCTLIVCDCGVILDSFCMVPGEELANLMENGMETKPFVKVKSPVVKLRPITLS